MFRDDTQTDQQKGRAGQNSGEDGRAVRQYQKGTRGLSEKEKAKRQRDQERARQWRKQNPEAAKARDQKYRKKTPGGYAAKLRAWRDRNLEASKAYHRAYMKRRWDEDFNYRVRKLLTSRVPPLPNCWAARSRSSVLTSRPGCFPA